MYFRLNFFSVAREKKNKVKRKKGADVSKFNVLKRFSIYVFYERGGSLLMFVRHITQFIISRGKRRNL